MRPPDSMRNRLRRWLLILALIFVSWSLLLGVAYAPAIGSPRWWLYGALVIQLILLVFTGRFFPLSAEFGGRAVTFRFLTRTKVVLAPGQVDFVLYRTSRWFYVSRPPYRQGFNAHVHLVNGTKFHIVCDGRIAYRMMRLLPPDRSQIVFQSRPPYPDAIPVRTVLETLRWGE